MSRKSILLMGLSEAHTKQFSAALLGQGFVVRALSEMSQPIAEPSAPDLILLDLQSTGIDALKHLRHWYNNSVLVLSNDDNEQQIIEALNSGASDYIHIPLSMPETLARIRVALREKRHSNNPVAEFGELTIDFPNRLVKLKNHFLKLSPIEYQLLVLLIRSENRVVTSKYLLERIWGEDEPEAITDLRVHIMHLRKKIEKNPGKPEIIVTEPKIGYKFITNSELQAKP